MRILSLLVSVVVLLSAFPALAQSESFIIVVNPSVTVDSMSKKELKRIFLKRKTRWPGGLRAEPVDQKATVEVRKFFSESVLGKSVADVNSYWSGQVFSGKDSPPPTKASDQAVLDYVRTTKGAVGYVSADADTSNLRILKLTD